MKCKFCGGTGTSNICVNGTFKPCPACDGTGEYEPFDADIGLDKLDSEPQTNEEWLKGLSTKRMANFLSRVASKCNDCGVDSLGDMDVKCPYNCGFCNKNAIEEWLKQPHT